jgi:predicted ester cyclase
LLVVAGRRSVGGRPPPCLYRTEELCPRKTSRWPAGSSKRAWNQGKLEVIDELTDEGFVGHDPAAGGEFDREGGKQQIQMYRSAFPDLHFEIEDAFASGDKVAVRWRSEGTFENELMGLEPTHQKGTITGIGIDRIEDGKVVESWNQWDNLQLMRDIGAIPEAQAAAGG